MATPSDLTRLPPTNGHDAGSESDWEYEYDANETEDIYFTLDLTTHVPNAVQEKTYAKNGRLVHPDAADKGNATAEGEPPQDRPSNGQNDAEAVDDETATEESAKLQILGLHTEKPYVKLNNSFYSCYWFTDLGTQFYITNPGIVQDPKLSGHVLDVVSSSQTRLVGRPATLKRKRGGPDSGNAQGENAARAMQIDEDGPSDVSDTEGGAQIYEAFQDPNEPLAIPREKIKDPHLEGQASFMERLSAIKLRKGERDAHKIPMRIPMYYKGAHNEDELRAAHASNAESTKQAQPRALPSTNADTDHQLAEASFTTPYIRRPRGGPRGGGIQSNASRRSQLGLEALADGPPRKRGRPSKGEHDLPARSNTFALDPQLGGPSPQTATTSALRPDDLPARSASIESLPPGPASTQDPKPRKGRRTRAQMEEAQRLEDIRKAKAAAAKAAEARRAEEAAREAARPSTSTFATDASGNRQERAARRKRAAIEAQEAQEELASRAVMRPGQVGREMVLRFDGAGDGDEDSGGQAVGETQMEYQGGEDGGLGDNDEDASEEV